MRKGYIFKRRSYPIAKWSLMALAVAIIAVAATPNSSTPIAKQDPAFATTAMAAVERSATMSCADFDNRAEAQAFMRGAGPGDPHHLDEDGDGYACERLP